jgi:erythromycin esterase
MADNIAALHAAAPNEKMMVWAHNYHVGRYSFVPSMGIHLQKALGRAYLAIGFVFGSGTFAAAGSRRDGSVTDAEVHGFGAPTPLDAAAPFVATGLAQLALDLRTLPQGPIGAWFAAPHLLREIGWLYTGEVADTKPRILTEQFDALLFVARSTPARALK